MNELKVLDNQFNYLLMRSFMAVLSTVENIYYVQKNISVHPFNVSLDDKRKHWDWPGDGYFDGHKENTR